MSYKSSSGFTLIELIVAIGVVGVLAQVSIAGFNRYKAKSRTAEAKVGLASIYMAMETFKLDFETYGTCLADMGYDPSSNVENRYYAIGFPAAVPAINADARSKGAICSDAAINQAYFPAGKSIHGVVADIPVGGGVSSSSYVASAFVHGEAEMLASVIEGMNPIGTAHAGGGSCNRAHSHGDLSGLDILDIWSIDNNKRLTRGKDSLFYLK